MGIPKPPALLTSVARRGVAAPAMGALMMRGDVTHWNRLRSLDALMIAM